MLSGCRTPSDDQPYYCVCPFLKDPIRKMSNTTLTPTPVSGDGGLSGGAVAGIVIGCVSN